MPDLLPLLLDTLIPPSDDRRMPGAGALGLAAAVRESVPDDALSAGLAALEGARFDALDTTERVALLRELEGSHPAFIPAVYRPTCMIYYQHPEVQAGLGVRPGPPHPKGYDLEPGNLDALERVRARGRLYREACGSPPPSQTGRPRGAFAGTPRGSVS